MPAVRPKQRIPSVRPMDDSLGNCIVVDLVSGIQINCDHNMVRLSENGSVDIAGFVALICQCSPPISLINRQSYT